ncbi:unnamed protein product [Prorocentrum cordatum]|uniref:Uncharacterized protein n=1 Tax=Prorocentrum cordatum TaxID=2364126 RepID=A0ABN9SPZ2_9DINO|nr:unnamed protein product [Polarella glacialis]
MEYGLPVADVERDELAQRGIAAYSIEKITKNENTDSRELFPRKKGPRAEPLTRHLDPAKHAGDLVGNAISEMDMGMLETTVEELQDGCAFIPNCLTFQLRRRYSDIRLADALKSHGASQLLAAIARWSGPADQILTGGKPQLCLLGCSDDEKIGHSEAMSDRLLSGVVKLGESGETGAAAIADARLSYCALKSVTDAELPSTALKALVLAAFAGGHAGLARAIALGANKGKADEKRAPYKLHLSLKFMPRYDGMFKEFRAKQQFTEEFPSNLPATEVEPCKGATAAGKSGLLGNLLTQMGQVATKCRTGAFEHLAELPTSSFETIIRPLNVASPTAVDGDAYMKLAPAGQRPKQGQAVPPDNVEARIAHNKAAEIAMATTGKADYANNVVKVLEKCAQLESGGALMDAVRKVERALKGAVEAGSGIEAPVMDRLEKPMQAVFGYANENVNAIPESLESVLQLVMVVRDMHLQEARQTFSGSLDAIITTVTAWSATLSISSKFETGWPDLASKAMGAFVEMLETKVGDLKVEYLRGATRGKADDFDVVRPIFTKAVADLDGNLFPLKLNVLQTSQTDVAKAYELFSEPVLP